VAWDKLEEAERIDGVGRIATGDNGWSGSGRDTGDNMSRTFASGLALDADGGSLSPA